MAGRGDTHPPAKRLRSPHSGRHQVRLGLGRAGLSLRRFMKVIFTWIARNDDELDVDMIKKQMTKSSNY
jgi:hypothetical protein